jgi:hypothetical protein
MQQTQQEFGMMKKINVTEKRDITQSDKFDEKLSTIQQLETQLRKPNFQNPRNDNEYQNPKRCYNCGKTEHLAQQRFKKTTEVVIVVERMGMSVILLYNKK